MAAAALEFNHDTHEYRIDGRVVPSVTTIIRTVLPGWQADPWYLQRGLATHHGCRLLDTGTLDWSTVSPEIEKRIQAWQKFKDEARCQVGGVEVQVCSRRYNFAGTLDRILFYQPKEQFAIGDLKNTAEAQVIIQLGGYSLAYAEQPDAHKITSAVAVELHDDGTYRTLWVVGQQELRRAEQTFLAALTVFNFMTKHNLRKGNP